MHFDACQDGLLDLVRAARDPAPAEVVVAGCEAHVCLLQTALGLLRAGFTVWVVADACGSRQAGNHDLAMRACRPMVRTSSAARAADRRRRAPRQPDHS
jgi:nicotinamidase-related amidase